MDITYELSRIAAAKYGLHLKDPIFAAFDKLVTDSKFNLLKDDFQDDFADYETMLTRFNDDETLSYILRDFLELYSILNGRMGFYAKHENPNEDEQISYWVDILIQELMNVANNNATRSLPINSYGIFNAVKIRASMYHILDILRYPNAVYGETATYKKKDPLYIYGRDINGIRVYGNKDGVGELYFDSGLPKIRIKIRVTPIMVDEEPVTMQSSFTRGQLHEGDYVDFPIPSSLVTNFSIFKVEILDYETELGVTYKLTRAIYSPTTVTQFNVDVHNYDDSDGKVYDVSGRELTTMIVTGAGGAYADSEGLYLPAGNVIQWLDLNMPLDEEWTLTYRMKDNNENPQGYNQFIQLRNQENENRLFGFQQEYQNPNLTWRELWQYCNFRLGSTLGDNSGVEVFNYAFHKYNGGTSGDIFDTGSVTQEMLPWCHEVVLICDTHNVSLYVNGIIKARASVSLFLEDMTKIIMGHPNNNASYKILHCSLKSGIHMPESVVYKMRIKSLFADVYLSLAKIGMYTGVSEGVGTGRFDYRTNNYVSGIEEATTEIATGVQPTRPDVRSFPASLLDLPSCNGGANTINGVYHNGVYNWSSSHPINVYFTVSLWALGNNAELTPEQANLYAYQFQTPDEPFPGRTPNSWELYKTLDGGLTWFKIDDRTITSQIPRNEWGPLMYPTST